MALSNNLYVCDFKIVVTLHANVTEKKIWKRNKLIMQV